MSIQNESFMFSLDSIDFYLIVFYSKLMSYSNQEFKKLAMTGFPKQHLTLDIWTVTRSSL